jgi:hypothetical protein
MSTNHGMNTEGYDNYRQALERHRRRLRRELLGLILNYDPADIRLALDLYDQDPKQFSCDVTEAMTVDDETRELAACARIMRDSEPI